MSPIVDAEIPVYINGREKRVAGVTKRTTCDEIVYALLQRDGCGGTVAPAPGGGVASQAALHSYSLFERWREVERPLAGRTKLLRTWQAWGDEQRNVKLLVKRLSSTDYVQREKMRGRSRPRPGSRGGGSRDTADGGQVVTVDVSSGGGSTRRSPSHHGARRGGGGVEMVTEKGGDETVIQVILKQDQRIHDQLMRLRQTDSEIEVYETRLHLQRMREQHSDSGEDSCGLGGTDGVMRRREKEEMCCSLEAIAKINLRLLEEEEKISTLWMKVQDMVGQVGGNKESCVGVDDVRGELARLLVVGECRSEEDSSCRQAIAYSERILVSKHEQFEHLTQELCATPESHDDTDDSIIPYEQGPYRELPFTADTSQKQQLQLHHLQHQPQTRQKHMIHLWQNESTYDIAEKQKNSPEKDMQTNQNYMRSQIHSYQHKQPHHHHNGYHDDRIPDPSPSPSSITSSSSAVSSGVSSNQTAARSSLTDDDVGEGSSSPVSNGLRKQHSDNESNSDDTGLSSLHSSEEVTYVLETLV